jgi:hypothetical protein
MSRPYTLEAEFLGGRYELSISASYTDPYQNTAEPANGERRLYLWLTSAGVGASAIQADVAGTLAVNDFTPMNDVRNFGEGGNLFCLVPGCPTGDANVLLGFWTVVDQGGGLCLQPSDWFEVLGAVDCRQRNPSVWDIRVRGFSSSGDPCAVGFGPDFLPHSALAEPSNPGSPLQGWQTPGSYTTALAPPRPNPFAQRSAFTFTLEAPQAAKLSVYEVSGRLVRVLVDEQLGQGVHVASWDGRDKSGLRAVRGTYFVRLEAGGRTQAQKIVLLGRE